MHKRRDVAQLGSAPVLGTGGRRFKSCHPYMRALKPAPLLFGPVTSQTDRQLNTSLCGVSTLR